MRNELSTLLIMFGLAVFALVGVRVAQGDEAASPAFAAKVHQVQLDSLDQARDWMVRLRHAHDGLSPAQAEALAHGYAKSSAAELRVLLMVYERTYRVAYPYVRPASTGDQLEDLREWLLANRIVRDNLHISEARQFASDLAQMSLEQLQSLAKTYESEIPLEEGNRDLAKREVRATELIRREIALNQASQLRDRVEQDQTSANGAAAVTAQYGIDNELTQREASRSQGQQHTRFQYWWNGWSTFY